MPPSCIHSLQRGPAGIRHRRGSGGLGGSAAAAEPAAHLQQLPAPRGRLQRDLGARAGGLTPPLHGGRGQDHPAQHQDWQLHGYAGKGDNRMNILK
jgi:hypothetical protein